MRPQGIVLQPLSGAREELRGLQVGKGMPIHQSLSFARCPGAFLLAALTAPAFAVEIDGRVDPQEWREARHITEFRKVQPLNGEPASLPTEAWVLATPEGLAVAFRNTQPP